ncbi:L-Aspartase-like [Moorella glycerini]|uniref:Adenylosuccinate lyase n=1 Tax=Neomoorella stamsii TaxID=1266720 RepID=A0A9X7J6C3_9FIRM|nr:MULTISPECIES: lyase family protein [Moorella]PRR76425.1 Adenylosuccinate lyase [Moorella stamsii]CEP67006.1 L-Aspartase-like [Moorella glycerini]
MAVYPADMEIYKNRFSTEEMRAIWDEANLLQKRLDVEAAVAKAELELGIIPEWAAKEIIEKANINYITPQLASEFKHGSDIVAMIKACEKVMGEAAEYLHFGLTSQDVLETSLALVLRETWKVIFRDLRVLEEILLDFAQKYKLSVMPGRPHGQYGTVTTFGFKAAIWATEVRRNIERLKELKKRLLVGNLTGAHGSLAPLVQKAGPGMGLKVQQRALELLGLVPADICTHQSRDRLTEFVSVLAMIGISLERICKTIFELHRPEIFELEGPFVEGEQVDSSTMPHRRGPSGVDWVMGFVRILRGNALVGMEVVVEDERDAARLPFEHASLPESCLITAAILQFMIKYLRGLKVHTENMEKDVTEYMIGRGQGGPFIQGECMLYTVAEKTGKKQSAHKMVYRVAQKAFHDKMTFREALLNDKEIMSYLTVEEIDAALDPHNYLGEIPIVVDSVVAKVNEMRRAEEELLN